MERKIFLAFTHVKKHIDLSFLDERKVLTELFIKGKQRPNGDSLSTVNTARFYLNGEIPEDYNLRINSMIEAIGGKEILKKLVEEYDAEYSEIALCIPQITSEDEEGGAISCETLQNLCDLKLGIQIILEYHDSLDITKH